MRDDSGREVNEAVEYGAPINPTTVSRGIYDLPAVDRDSDMVTPTVTDRPIVDSLGGTARAGQVQPRESGPGATGSEDVTRPEALGSTDDTKRS